MLVKNKSMVCSLHYDNGDKQCFSSLGKSSEAGDVGGHRTSKR